MGQTNQTETIQESGYVKHTAVQVSRAEIYEGHLVLVNQANPIKQPIPLDKLIPLSTNPDMIELEDGMLLEKTCLQHFIALLHESQGMNDIVSVSAFRTREEQEQIYETSLVENGAEYTACYVALPGHSEHQTGLAIDVGKIDDQVDFIAPSFPDSGIYMTFKQLAAENGFIQRYKAGKEAITNISCEPWHFRYVGYPHAEIMEQHDLCLEEYIDFVRKFRYGGDYLTVETESMLVQIYYVPAEDGLTTSVPIINGDLYRLSGNNRDGFIVTAFTGKGQITHGL
ncbi:D-alanyl-D-alanine carboxypeptidase family protein [Bacillus sp. FJAT-28004]|uniref:D-alanyl-D-alanine carboxypeptidase family protein n=1 Tax=Bacillus sp. FJAT-28004 TaxID=1679165 RepID=UPI000A9CD01E|nr:D-alanyl-D-alanine carboxypeptidase family protein [Bacillus sp. FJAT-28004]